MQHFIRIRLKTHILLPAPRDRIPVLPFPTRTVPLSSAVLPDSFCCAVLLYRLFVFRYTPMQKLLDDFEGHASVFLLSVAGMER